MSEVKETDWAYLAGMIDGEGYLYVLLHSNPSYRREMKKGYAREFRCFISSGSKDLLEKIQTNIGNIGTITRHKYKPETLKDEKYRGKHRVDNYTLRFYQGALRKILPKVIPYLILKKEPAEVMLKMLEIVKKIHNPEQRERTLLLMQKQFDEACFKSAGNKYRKNRKQNAIIERMIGRDGKIKLTSFT